MDKVQNGEDYISVKLKLNLDPDIDKEKVTKYLEKVFRIANKFGIMLHKEQLTIGEALFIAYILENGALSTINTKDDKIYETLVEGNDTRLNVIANMIIKNAIIN